MGDKEAIISLFRLASDNASAPRGGARGKRIKVQVEPIGLLPVTPGRGIRSRGKANKNSRTGTPRVVGRKKLGKELGGQKETRIPRYFIGPASLSPANNDR